MSVAPEPGVLEGLDAWRQLPVDQQPAWPDEAAVRDAVLIALTTEIGLMLDEGVVGAPEQIDTCLLLGAGWPGHLGGISAYLDRSGYSRRILGRRLLADGVANVRRELP